MKAVILLVAILATTVSAHSQKLKDLLYGGKLKLDSGAVIRSSDDLSTKIDTSTKKPVTAEKVNTINTTPDIAANGTVIPVTTTTAATGTDPATTTTAATVAKDNNQVWKDYVTEFIGTMKTEVLPSKKVKEGSYSILLECEIGTDGGIAVNNVSCVPENSFLAQQVKERFMLGAPRMTPLLGANGRPRKAIKKQTITLTK